MNGFITGMLPFPGVIKNINSIDVKKISNLGKISDRGGFTKAGRGQMKHGYRGESVFKKPIGTRTQVNKIGQTTLEGILNHPNKVVVEYTHKLHCPVIEIEASTLGGVRFTGDGNEMMGFLEPRWCIKTL